MNNEKILGLAPYAAVMFGVTAGLGLFMMKKTPSHGSDHAESSAAHGAFAAADDADETSHATEVKIGSSHVRTVDASSSHGGRHAAESGSHAPAGGHSDLQLPVAVRSSPMSVEEIVRMGLSLKSRDEVLRQRELSLKDAESQHRLIQTDVEGAQQQVENLLAQANNQRAAIEELVARMNTQKEAVNSERLAIAGEKQQLKVTAMHSMRIAGAWKRRKLRWRKAKQTCSSNVANWTATERRLTATAPELRWMATG